MKISVHPLHSFSMPFSSDAASKVRVLVVPTDIILPPFFFALLILSAASCDTM
jgi:hypothetical protein